MMYETAVLAFFFMSVLILAAYFYGKATAEQERLDTFDEGNFRACDVCGITKKKFQDRMGLRDDPAAFAWITSNKTEEQRCVICHNMVTK